MTRLSKLLALLLLAGCAPDPGASPYRRDPTPDPNLGGDAGTSSAPPTAPPPTDACGGRATSVSGVVTFPNGSLPVARALVYVPVSPSGDVARSGTCGECIDRAGTYAIAETSANGRFELANVPSDTTMVVVRKGPFERRVAVALTACGPNVLSGDQTRLPRDSSEGTVPRIAVVTGTWDHMETVLARVGLSSAVVDVVPGDPDAGSRDGGAGLFRDRARLMSYDYVFVDCGAGFADDSYDPSALREPAVRDNVRSFVEDGGRLYVTDLAYDVAEAAVPSAFDFGSPGGLSDTPEPVDAAANGRPIDGAAHAAVIDDDLREWLSTNGAVDASGLMEVRGLEEGWAMVRAASAERAKVWVEGPVDAPSASSRPLTVTADRGCGRTLFTSYHTLEGGGGSALSAQEQALAYLILEIGNCVEEPALF